MKDEVDESACLERQGRDERNCVGFGGADCRGRQAETGIMSTCYATYAHAFPHPDSAMKLNKDKSGC